MAEKKNFEELSDEELKSVTGGTSKPDAEICKKNPKLCQTQTVVVSAPPVL